jgi:uncharacterized repeat protein (TIGR01451 family)
MAIPISVYLDDVTVGSAHPDLWLASLPQQNALPGEAVTYQLIYGNQGGAAAAETTITIHLPDDLLFVSATPAPIINGTSLTWDLADLPAFSAGQTITLTLEVGEQAALLTIYTATALIATPDPELELLNNERPLRVFTGRQLHLPAIFK